MIRQLTGTVVDISDTSIVLAVHDVGYGVFVSSPTQFQLDQTVCLYTHHAIRETASDLYGFTTRDERDVFETLLTIPKIGPKSAAGIMATADINLIKTAVVNNDAEHLSKQSGVGKKTAENIVSGLHRKVDDLGWGVPGADGAGPNASPAWQTDAIDALITLGYPQAAARKTIQQLPADVTSTNEAVKQALSILGQNS